MSKKTNRYIIGGKTVSGVTTIIGHKVSRQLCYWYGKNGTEECNRISDEAKAFGEGVHKMIDAYIEGQEQHLSKDFQVILNNFKLKTKGWKFIETEKIVLNPRDMYGGTVDLIAGVNGVKTLIDIKTGNLYDGAESIQLAAYMECDGMEDVKEQLVLQLDKETLSWEVLHRPTVGLYPIFKAYKTIYDYERSAK